MLVGAARAIVDGAVVQGDVEVQDGRVVAVGRTPAGTGGTAVAGFVDVQVNGFGGVDFLSTDVEGYRRAGAALAGTGVTAYQPTFISSPVDAYWPALKVAAAAVEEPGPRVLGVHLEGPFLSREWAGAHDPENIVDPDPVLAERLLAAGPVTYMTLAPERPGGLDLVRQMIAAGLVVSLGHCDADAATANAAYDLGASAITHLYNAQRRWKPRDPGVAGVALTRGDVAVQAIVDHIHLAPEAAAAAWQAARGRFVLVTDAMEAAGLPPGRYRLGDRDVAVADGAVRLADGTLAGSALTMDTAVRNLVALGASLAEAVDAATRVPARLLRRPDLGVLRPGARADVTVLDEELRVTRTLVDGREVFAG